jgi:hypothetical protein
MCFSATGVATGAFSCATISTGRKRDLSGKPGAAAGSGPYRGSRRYLKIRLAFTA